MGCIAMHHSASVGFTWHQHQSVQNTMAMDTHYQHITSREQREKDDCPQFSIGNENSRRASLFTLSCTAILELGQLLL